MKIFNSDCQDREDRPESYIVREPFRFGIAWSKGESQYSNWVPVIYHRNEHPIQLGSYSKKSEAIAKLETFVHDMQGVKV